MCIRDRSLEEYLGKEISGIPRPGHIPGAVHVAWSGFLNACLLYTSDAADERSSVDLGGRRIIKKKKTEQDCTAT